MDMDMGTTSIHTSIIIIMARVAVAVRGESIEAVRR
jgi:hypothetical protein